MRIICNLVLGAVAALGMVLPAVAAERAIIVLDGSGSMWAQIDGKARITIARETLGAVLTKLPDNLELGFMTYGHREKGNCTDIEMLVEPAIGTGAAIIAAADAITPKGMTPISDAVRLAAENLRFTEDKATVILITDGLETCEVDPCALALELESQGVDFTTHVLGFGLSDAEGQQVVCLAENTGGKYLSANDGAALVDALTTTVAQVAKPAPEPKTAPEPGPIAEYNFKPTASLAEGGPNIIDDKATRADFLEWIWYKVTADGGQGDEVNRGHFSDFESTLEPGDYIMTAGMGLAMGSQKVAIEAGAVAVPHFVLNAAFLRLHPMASEGGEVDDDATIVLRRGEESLSTSYGDLETVVPAGPIDADVTIGEATLTRSYDIKAGEAIDEDVIVSVGLAKIASFYVEGSPIDEDIFIEVLEAKKALDGTRKSVTYGYGGDLSFELPPGDYVATYGLEGTAGEVPFSIKASELTEVPVILDAGVLVVTVPGDDYVELVSVEADIAGNRKLFDRGFGPEVSTTLAVGDYLILSLDQETPITIVGGERSEVIIVPTGKSK